jgi:flavodoxin
MRTLVTYESRSGNTERIAKAIYEAVEGEKEIRSIGEVESLEGYDLIFVGHPIVKEGPPKRIARLLQNAEGKNVALFVTHAMPSTLDWFNPVLPNCQKTASRTNLQGLFECQGEMANWVKWLLHIHPRAYVRQWARMNGDSHGHGHPNANDEMKAASFAREIMASLRS